MCYIQNHILRFQRKLERRIITITHSITVIISTLFCNQKKSYFKYIYLNKAHACHTIDTQDAPWPRKNENMNATVAVCGIAMLRAFLKMYIHTQKNVANLWFRIYSCETRLHNLQTNLLTIDISLFIQITFTTYNLANLMNKLRKSRE